MLAATRCRGACLGWNFLRPWYRSPVGSAARIASHNVCASTPLWGKVSFVVGLLHPCRISKYQGCKSPEVVIFFSLTEAPLPDPTPTPPNTPKQTRNGAETEPKRSQTEPKRSQTEPKWTEIKLFGVGRAGGLSG